MTDWLSESVKGIAPSNIIKNRRESKVTKKCKCKKCVYCKQIITGTPIFRVKCEKYGDDKYLPKYCDQYTTKEEFNAKQIAEKLTQVQTEIEESFLTPEMIKLLAEFFAIPQRIAWDDLTNK